MIPEGKKVVVDRVYGTKKTPDDHAKLSLPNLCDDKKTANFKARLRCRHESFNGRIKQWRSLYDTYHHASSTHASVFEAVCVIVQYQMENGSPLFDA